MFGAKKLVPQPLKPFVLRIREGFLVGLAMDPVQGAPCIDCVVKWLEQRNVWVEKALVSDLKIRRDVLADLLAENDAHIFYEIAIDGTANRLDCVVFPHPDCVCDKTNYVAAKNIGENTNFAFSPLVQIKCARFATPSGNLWLTSATGKCHAKNEMLTVYSVDCEKHLSRLSAVEKWMQKAASAELENRLGRREPVACESLQTAESAILSSANRGGFTFETTGSGKTREEAVLNGLYQLAKLRTLRQYSNSVKSPMLVVGANNWLRTRVPFFLLQQFDLHLLFYPNSAQAWVIGLAAFSRTSVDEKPIFVFDAHAEVGKAVEGAIYRLLETVRSQEFDAETWNEMKSKTSSAKASKLNMWWTHWIYRCPKISLKDVLHLEAYSKDIETWREYFRDGLDQVRIISLNTSTLPSQVRHLVKIEMSAKEQSANVRKINGIGTWSDFRDGLQ